MTQFQVILNGQPGLLEKGFIIYLLQYNDC